MYTHLLLIVFIVCVIIALFQCKGGGAMSYHNCLDPDYDDDEKTEDELLDEVLFDMYPGSETDEELEAAIEDNVWSDD